MKVSEKWNEIEFQYKLKKDVADDGSENFSTWLMSRIKQHVQNINKNGLKANENHFVMMLHDPYIKCLMYGISDGSLLDQ